MIDYKYKKKENKFTENGHTMFEEDVLQRLKRLADLEEQINQGQTLPIDSVSKSACVGCGEDVEDYSEDNNCCTKCWLSV